MRIIIKSMEADLADVSTYEKNAFFVIAWVIRYEVCRTSSDLLVLVRHNIEGTLYWKQEPDTEKIMNAIEEIFSDGKTNIP